MPELTVHLKVSCDSVGFTVTENGISSPGLVSPTGPSTEIAGHCGLTCAEMLSAAKRKESRSARGFISLYYKPISKQSDLLLWRRAAFLYAG